ncbi:MAG: metal-dependent hydrolase [Bacteroidetes bacterium]|nr:MAG: metal-dependent hydrolase [Bacteroidota bacterium]REJ99762.1 MAG: metal-dependent hydrolase [Bacteroidota bacterium]REK34135.1 MAG: metal-dependent hydrolase [Bacteroidota bacterium]REK50691.1 MAG: metal-dependent hydrolase [Bacteroidota bacterium]
MIITYYGHSCFQVSTNGKTLLFDPFIRPNPKASHIDFENIKADYILVSHGHEDHTADLVDLARQTNATIISSYEIHAWLQKKGIIKTHPMNTGGHWMFDFGKVKCVHAVHSSSLPDGTYAGNAMGFLIETPDIHFYYAGDTALHSDMKLIGEFRTIDFAFLPIGNNFTMGIDNAVIASNFIKCEKIIGMHYDTFDMIKIDQEDARKRFDNAGKELLLMNIGETTEI